MITTQNIYKLPFTPSAKITFADGTVKTVTGAGIHVSGSRVDQSAGVSTLPIGCVVGRSFTLELINNNSEWNSYDFFGALVELHIDYSNGDVFSLLPDITFKNLAIVEPPEDFGPIISLTAVDNAWRLDNAFTTALSFPCSVGNLWREICSNCGISNGTISHVIFSESIQTKPTGDLTFRQVVGFIAMLAAANARITPSGQLVLVDIKVPTASDSNSAHNLNDWISVTTAIHDVEITGVQMTITNSAGEAEELLEGAEGYVIGLETNPLMSGQESYFLQKIYSAVNGLKLRKYSGNLYFYPNLEVYDGVKITDAAGNVSYSLVTDVSWGIGGKTAVSGNIETPRSKGKSVDPSMKALIQARQLIANERSAREQAVIDLQNALASASGLYQTAVTQPDQSIIYYLHDKSTLATSTNVIKLTSEALALSTDGGQTYPYGFMINGDVIARILSARGVNADWINAGALVIQDQVTHEVLFAADVDAGTVYIDGITVDDGEITVGEQGDDNKIVINSDGIYIINNGVETVKFEGRKVSLPVETEVPWGSALRLGGYHLEAKTDETFEVVWAPRGTGHYIFPDSSGPHFIDGTYAARGTPGTSGYELSDDGVYMRGKAVIKVPEDYGDVVLRFTATIYDKNGNAVEEEITGFNALSIAEKTIYTGFTTTGQTGEYYLVHYKLTVDSSGEYIDGIVFPITFYVPVLAPNQLGTGLAIGMKPSSGVNNHLEIGSTWQVDINGDLYLSNSAQATIADIIYPVGARLFDWNMTNLSNMMNNLSNLGQVWTMYPETFVLYKSGSNTQGIDFYMAYRMS